MVAVAWLSVVLFIHSFSHFRVSVSLSHRFFNSNFQAIGKGAYGVVASARDEVTGERVAVKKVT